MVGFTSVLRNRSDLDTDPIKCWIRSNVDQFFFSRIGSGFGSTLPGSVTLVRGNMFYLYLIGSMVCPEMERDPVPHIDPILTESRSAALLNLKKTVIKIKSKLTYI